MIDWTRFGTPEERRRRKDALERGRLALASIAEGSERSGDGEQLSLLGLSAIRAGDHWVLLYSEPESRAIAEQLLRNATPQGRCVVGRLPVNPQEALSRVQAETGIDLGSSRVRVGVTRGHLLQVAISVPLDVVASDAALEDAAEEFVTLLLGDCCRDDWLVDVRIERSSRQKGLLVVQDAVRPAANYPVLQASELLRKGIAAIEAERYGQKRETTAPAWTALEISPAGDGLQPDRRFASTLHPEALKAALQGLPFCSKRFHTERAIFCWMAWESGTTGEQRVALRQSALEWLESGEEDVEVAGTGFGLTRDFIDLWAAPRHEVLERVGAHTARLVGCEVQLGLYDTKWQTQRLSFSLD